MPIVDSSAHSLLVKRLTNSSPHLIDDAVEVSGAESFYTYFDTDNPAYGQAISTGGCSDL